MRQIFLDCDGVLADFEGAFEKLKGIKPRVHEAQVGTDAFWEELRQETDFFGTLPLMPDAIELVKGVMLLGYHPKILTSGYGWIAEQKIIWGKLMFPKFEMICCNGASQKFLSAGCGRGDVLIDDYNKYAGLWTDAGGIFIHHVSAKQSLEQLRVVLQKTIVL